MKTFSISELSMSLTPSANHRCCLDNFGSFLDGFRTPPPAEGQEPEQEFTGEVTEGHTLECPCCHAKNTLDSEGTFVWVDPDLVEVEKDAPVVVVPEI